MTRRPTAPQPLLLAATQTLRHAQAEMARVFAAAGLETPDVDARFLLRGVLQLTPEDLLRDPDRPVGAGAAALQAAVSRRLAREPVSRILGVREFYGREFHITPAVLDPRPDTETLIDAVLAFVRRRGWERRALRIADIGIGSGAILVTLLCELPHAAGVGTDVSAAALACAEANARRLGVVDRFAAVETDLLTGVPGPFDIIVSNPPYIPHGDLARLDDEVRLYDPALALDGGADGLDLYRRIAISVSALRRVSFVGLEVGIGQADDILGLFTDRGSDEVRWTPGVYDDLGGVRRCVTLERHC